MSEPIDYGNIIVPIEYGSIIVPIDFSAASRRAARLAAGLCPEDGKLTFLHVVWPPDERHPQLAWSSAQRNTAREEAMHRLEVFVESLGLAYADLEVRVGPVAPTIIDLLGELRPELLVIPSHDRPNFVRWFRGSVSEPVVREAPCACLVLPPAHDPARADAMDERIIAGKARVLVAVDLDDPSTSLIARGAASTDSQNKVHVFHAVPSPMPYGPAGLWNQYYGELASLRARQVVAQQLARAGFDDAYAEVGSGPAGHAIAEHAEGIDADLVVLASHGRTGWRRFVLGSVTESYLREAARPTLITRVGGQAHQQSAA